MPKIKKMLSPEEVAQCTGTSLSEVISWIESEQLPARKIAKAWKVGITDLNNFLETKRLGNDIKRNEGKTQMMQPQLCSNNQQLSLDIKAPNTSKSSRSRTGLFAKALMKDTIEILPLLPATESIEEVRTYLRNNIHYNAVQTRERFASYILKHSFPSGKPDQELMLFARKFRGTQALKDVCLYRFMISQPLMQSIILDLLLPALGQGTVPRSKLTQYLSNKFPSTNQKTIQSTVSAACEALDSSGLAVIEKNAIRFASRSVVIESFAFLLHSEFPEPGMHYVSRLESNLAYRSLLWQPDKVMQGLYELRNRGIVAKISDIDGLRQFTTKFSLQEMIEQLQPVGVPV